MRQDERGAVSSFFPFNRERLPGGGKIRAVWSRPSPLPGLSPALTLKRGCFIGSLCAQGLARCTDGGHPFRTIPGPLDTSRSYLESSEQKDFQVTSLEPARG